MTTHATFIAAIQAMTVSGVDRHYDEPPASVDIAGGECAFPLMPSGDRGEMVTTCVNMSKSRSIGYVIIIDAAGQGTQAQNYTKLAGFMDALETALDALTPGTLPFMEYEMTTTGNYPIGGSDYWAIIANVTIRDA